MAAESGPGDDLAAALIELRDRLTAITGVPCLLGPDASDTDASGTDASGTDASDTGAAGPNPDRGDIDRSDDAEATDGNTGSACLQAEVVALVPVDPHRSADHIAVDARVLVSARGGDHLVRASLVATGLFGLLADRRWQLDSAPRDGSAAPSGQLTPAYEVTLPLRRRLPRPTAPPVRYPLEVRPQTPPGSTAANPPTRPPVPPVPPALDR